jgi:hypothetical protein
MFATVFDGVNDYATAAEGIIPGGSSALTLCGWIKITSSGNRAIIGRFTTTGNQRQSLLAAISGKLRFFVSGNGNNTYTATSSVNINTGLWVHVAGTYDGTTIKL